MARKTSKHLPQSSRAPARKSTTPTIPEPFHAIEASIVKAGDATVKVPMLVLRGEWLKQCGFPIGSFAYVTADRRGAIALNRLGLSLPRRVRIESAPPTKR